MQTTKVTLYGKKYSIFEVTAFEGTPREQHISVAEYALDRKIGDLIDARMYTKDVQNIDTLYGYALTRDVDANDEKAVRRYVEQLLDDDPNPLD